MLKLPFAPCPSLLAIATALALHAGCSAQTAHDKVFFSCSAQAPECPENQVCNLEDNCCHLVDEAAGTELGQCKLGPGGTGFPGGSGTNDEPKSWSISTQ